MLYTRKQKAGELVKQETNSL